MATTQGQLTLALTQRAGQTLHHIIKEPAITYISTSVHSLNVALDADDDPDMALAKEIIFPGIVQLGYLYIHPTHTAELHLTDPDGIDPFPIPLQANGYFMLFKCDITDTMGDDIRIWLRNTASVQNNIQVIAMSKS